MVFLSFSFYMVFVGNILGLVDGKLSSSQPKFQGGLLMLIQKCLFSREVWDFVLWKFFLVLGNGVVFPSSG